jgi:hypothetical protein
MRQHREIEDKPSPRQGINMGKLLLPPYMRKGHLTFNDLINVAKITSSVDNQAIAEKVAAEILVNVDPDEPLPDPSPDGESFLNLLQKATDDQIEVTPYAKGLENELGMAANETAPDQFSNFENKPDIGVGPGEDELIKTGVKYIKDIRKKETRQVLMELLKDKLLKLGREFERKEDFNKSRNLMPFQPGEDTDLIDEERSLDNILDLGRAIEDIRWDDFLMRQRQKQKRHIVFILDISNTMFYDLEGINSISYSIMSLVPLLWGLRREKFSLCLYESNTHIVKDFYDEVNVIPILEDLVSMMFVTTTEMEKRYSRGFTSMTWGGTLPGKSLEWAYDEITDISERGDRMVFIFSDFVLTQPGEETDESKANYEILRRMTDMGARVCACVSPLAHKSIFKPYTQRSLDEMKKLGIKMVDTYLPSVFLEEASKFIADD